MRESSLLKTCSTTKCYVNPGIIKHEKGSLPRQTFLGPPSCCGTALRTGDTKLSDSAPVLKEARSQEGGTCVSERYGQHLRRESLQDERGCPEGGTAGAGLSGAVTAEAMDQRGPGDGTFQAEGRPLQAEQRHREMVAQEAGEMGGRGSSWGAVVSYWKA